MKTLEEIKAEIKRLQDQHCASPEVALDTIYTFIESLEEQNELTWQDVKQIMSIADMLIVSNEPSKFPTEQRFYEEVLKEFTTPSNSVEV